MIQIVVAFVKHSLFVHLPSVSIDSHRNRPVHDIIGQCRTILNIDVRPYFELTALFLASLVPRCIRIVVFVLDAFCHHILESVGHEAALTSVVTVGT